MSSVLAIQYYRSFISISTQLMSFLAIPFSLAFISIDCMVVYPHILNVLLF